MKHHRDQPWFASGQMKELLCHHFQHGKFSSKIRCWLSLGTAGRQNRQRNHLPLSFSFDTFNSVLCTTKGFKFFLPQQKSVSYKNKTSFGLIHSTAEKFL